jgi:hypothetical protein
LEQSVAKKVNKRKDGKPTRAEKRARNQSDYAKSKKDFSLYMPPSARARYKIIIDAIKNKQIETDADRQQAVIALIIGGLSLRWAREIVGVEHMEWHRWLAANEELKKNYQLAKEERTEAWADDIMEDAEAANAFNAQAVRLRIETKKWLMGKHSGRYADKVVIAGDKENPLTMVTADMTAEQSQEAYNNLKRHVGQNLAKLTEQPKPSGDSSSDNG